MKLTAHLPWRRGSEGAVPGVSSGGPLTRGRRALRRWFHSRLPRTDTLALTHRNVYITDCP